jgi:hypothetical protein
MLGGLIIDCNWQIAAGPIGRPRRFSVKHKILGARDVRLFHPYFDLLDRIVALGLSGQDRD